MTEFPQRGEIYLVKLPGHPRDRKARPAMVVSLDVRNRLANDVMVVPLSTTLREAPTHVRIAEGEVPKVSWKNSAAACVVLASPGYPNSVEKNILIEGDVFFCPSAQP